MAHKMTCSVSKKSAGMKAGPTKKAKAGDPLGGFDIQDNGDQTYTFTGVDTAGNKGLDISAIATLSDASSDDPAVVTVDTPGVVTLGVHAAVPVPAVGAKAVVSVTVNFTDKSAGPFAFTWPQTVKAGPITGVEIVPGVATVH